MSSAVRMVVADPSLIDARGHHFVLSLQVMRGAISQGINVIWFTHCDFIAPDWLKGISVYPIFSITMYDRYRPEKKNNLPKNIDQILLSELSDGIDQSGLNAKDHIFFHTGFGDLFRAIPGYQASLNRKEVPYLHICTPYDPVTMPGKDPGDGLLDTIKNIRTMEAVDKKIFFWAETPQLAQHYTSTYGFNVRALPLSAPTINEDEKYEKMPGIFTMLYLGAAREEKGFLHLPGIVDELYEQYGKTGKIRFIIQCTPQIVGYLPVIKNAIEKLSKYPRSYVKLIESVLDEKDYHSYLMTSDVLLLLYDRESYRIRGSGIAVEAICANKNILTFDSTFCASLITHGGGGVIHDVKEAVAVLENMIEKKEEYRIKAMIQGEVYRKNNNVVDYVSKIISQVGSERLTPFFPSSVVGHVSPQLIKSWPS